MLIWLRFSYFLLKFRLKDAKRTIFSSKFILLILYTWGKLFFILKINSVLAILLQLCISKNIMVVKISKRILLTIIIMIYYIIKICTMKTIFIKIFVLAVNIFKMIKRLSTSLFCCRYIICVYFFYFFSTITTLITHYNILKVVIKYKNCI